MPRFLKIKGQIFFIIIVSLIIIPNESNAANIFSESFDTGMTFEQLVEAGKWQLGLPWGETFDGVVEISNEQAHSGAYSLKITGSNANSIDSVVSHSIHITDQVLITIWFYDNISTNTGYITIAGISKGEIPANGIGPNMIAGGIIDASRQHYQFRDDLISDNLDETTVSRSAGWQKLEFNITSESTELLINGISVHSSSYITTTSLQYIFLGSFWNTGIMYFDDILIATIIQSKSITTSQPVSQNPSTSSNSAEVRSCLNQAVLADKVTFLGCSTNDWAIIGVVFGIFIAVLSYLRKK